MDKLQRDGVALAYEDAGQGEPPIVLVHGWTCDHTYFAPQAERYSRNHRVISVDLRGHGESDKPQQDYTMAQFADDLAWLCEQLRVQKPVVIGHSMGGVIAFELAARHPDLPAAVVADDAPIAPPQVVRDAIAPVIEGVKTPNYRQVSQDFVANALFMPTDDPALKARVVEGMSSAPQHVMASAIEHIFACDTETATAAVKVPALLLNAEGPVWPLAGLARIKELCPQVMIGQTVGAGHFHQLVVPDQVNAMIDRFLAVAVPAPALAV
ncbi:MAG TPA: alpha/beta hydrolase [Chloroflexota bacterium]|nr:alpha/beta hydrolase [Chloroflexota bacterium]